MAQICIDFERTFNRPFYELLSVSSDLGVLYISNLNDDTLTGSRFNFRMRYVSGDKFDAHERKHLNNVLTNFTKAKRKKVSHAKAEDDFLRALGW